MSASSPKPAQEVDSWFETHTFHHSRFSDIRRLVELKKKKNVRISLAFPTRNEASTIGKEIRVVKSKLHDKYPLIDEIAVIDSDSTDGTREVAKLAGAKVYLSREILPSCGSYSGKGENLWKSLFVLSGDIIVWIDADIKNIHPKFVYGLIGPLLEDDKLGYVKAFYERPIKVDKRLHPSGGGRVTEILIRPLLATFYSQLSFFLQPLAGEYAGRRSILETIPFWVGYGVEIGHLLDIYEKYGLSIFAQVDLDRRVHRNQPLHALNRMSFVILQTFLAKLEQANVIKLKKKISREGSLIKVKKDLHTLYRQPSSFYIRLPMITIPEYRKKRGIK